jgi:hypothetical protein
MPYCAATLVNSARSGGVSPTGGLSETAGVPMAFVNASNLAGVWNVRYRACRPAESQG